MLNTAVYNQFLAMLFYAISYSVFIRDDGKHYEVSERRLLNARVTGMSGIVGEQVESVLLSTPTYRRCSPQMQSSECCSAYFLPPCSRYAQDLCHDFLIYTPS